MTTEVLLKLIEAGYTKDDIALMEEVEAKPIESAVTEMPAEAEQAEQAAGEEPPKTETDPSERMTETISDIMQIITKMQKTLDGMQQKNAKNAESEQPARLTADDVVKNFFGDMKKA